jgi:hypothetical protein
MLPEGHRGVVVCGTRRAERWRYAFLEAGIKAVIVETDGNEAAAGACKVGVPQALFLQAQAVVAEVNAGERRLPGPTLSWQTVIALLAILCVVVWMLAR